MDGIKIAIGADHRGFALKESFKKAWQERLECGLLEYDLIEWVDCGAFDDDRSDYPTFAHSVSKNIISGEVDRGILLCGTGAGMAMAANRHYGIYAAVAWNKEVAQRVRREDHCNVLVLPADYLSVSDVVDLVRAWLGAEPQEGRYAERIKMVDVL